MEILHSIYDFEPNQKTFVTMGTFDGVHIGHQKILKKLVKDSKKEDKKSVLLTFFPHPRMVLEQNSTIKLIQTIDERAKALEKLGLDYLIIHPFSKEFSKLTALEFVRDIFVNQLDVSKLIIGYDHRFGNNREGNILLLNEYSDVYNFTVEEIPAQDIDEVYVSSTKVRKAISEGKINKANSYLGSFVTLFGKVVKGMQIGSKIGFPTANIYIKEAYKLLPKNGVYVIQSTINGVLYKGMMNIGRRPTFSNENNLTIEVHLFDFNDNIYGENIRIDILHFIRDEKKFDSVDDLVTQLQKDQIIAKNKITY